MQPISDKTVKLLSRSGLVLIFFSMIGSFAMATITVSSNVQQQAWNELFGLLFLAIMGIAIYYIALSLFGLVLMKSKKASASLA